MQEENDILPQIGSQKDAFINHANMNDRIYLTRNTKHGSVRQADMFLFVHKITLCEHNSFIQYIENFVGFTIEIRRKM